MGHKLSKKQKKVLKDKHRRKKIKKLESQDARGISRKKYKLVIKSKTFFIMKIIGIVSIPLAYFLYSPLLILVMIYFVALYFAAVGCEHSLNKSVIKSNHIKIPKYDSAIALLLVCVTIFGSVFSASSGPVGMFQNTIGSKIKNAIKNFGSLLTGFRSIFGMSRDFGFGPMDKPEGFVPDKAAFEERFGSEMGGPRPGGRPMDFEMSMDDIPIEFMFSQILSTAITIMIFMVMVLGIISLYHTYRKIKKFNVEQNTLIVENSINVLTNEEYERLFDFGSEEVDNIEQEG
jgi:hypothetical protein